jgi:hypothetical protein
VAETASQQIWPETEEFPISIGYDEFDFVPWTPI